MTSFCGQSSFRACRMYHYFIVSTVYMLSCIKTGEIFSLLFFWFLSIYLCCVNAAMLCLVIYYMNQYMNKKLYFMDKK